VPCQLNAGQNDSTKVTNKSFQIVENSNIWQKTLPNQNCMHEESKSSLKSRNACYRSVQEYLAFVFII
jgi:hypothetical protein